MQKEVERVAIEYLTEWSENTAKKRRLQHKESKQAFEITVQKTIESLRKFPPETQINVETIAKLLQSAAKHLMPAYEVSTGLSDITEMPADPLVPTSLIRLMIDVITQRRA